MYDRTLLLICKSPTYSIVRDIRPQIEWTVNQVITDGHYDHPQGFVWVCMA